jgi:hypothetical protein
MDTWCFKTATRHTHGFETHQWYWQLDSGNSLLLTSLRLFASLEECVIDAQQKGFPGALQVPRLLSYPVTLTWSEGSPTETRIGSASASGDKSGRRVA